MIQPFKKMHKTLLIYRKLSLLATFTAVLSLSGCKDQSASTKVALGTVAGVRYTFAVGQEYTQVDAAGRSILVRGVAPLPVNTAVELRGSVQHAQLLCVSGSQRCWSMGDAQEYDWTLLNLKP